MSIPALKQSAKQLGIDLIVDAPEGEWTPIHILIIDYYQLVLLGWIAGVDSTINSLKNPLAEAVEKLQRKVDDFKSKEQRDEN